MRILISDIENRKTFDIVSIARLHYPASQLILGGNETGFLLKRIYGKIVLLRTDEYAGFEQDLKAIIASEQEAIFYVAVEEKTTALFYEYLLNHPADASKLVGFLPAQEHFVISRNKYLLNQFCAEHDIAVPEIIAFDRIEALKNNFTPLIYKPKEGSGSKGIKLIKTAEDLDGIIPDDNFFLQRFVGNGINVEGGFYLMNKGELVSFYSHKRIRTYPPEGGVTVYSQTVDNVAIRDAGAKLLKALNWSGWAMVEFIYDEVENKYTVIEINPRAWGSILLSEFNNADFFRKYIALGTGSTIENKAINYNTYIRWLFPWDVILFAKKKGKISGFWKFNRKQTCYIGFTYASWWRSFLFIFYSVFDLGHLKKVLKGA